jgi:inosine-uridine nucleoside N-ribohydrolase
LRSRSGFVALVAAVVLTGELVSGWAFPPGDRPLLVAGAPIDAGDATPSDLISIRPSTLDLAAPNSGSPERASTPPETEPAGPLATGGPTTTAAATGTRTSTNAAETSPVPVIFDTDMGNDVDDSLALAMLHGYDALGLIDLLAVTINYDDPLVAGYVDAVNTYHGAGDTPIGAITNGGVTDGGNSFHRQVAQSDARFPHDLATNADAEPAIALLRQLLHAQPNHSVVIIAVGFSTNLAQLLDSPPDEISDLGGVQLVARKVKLLSNMAGEFVRARPEFNVDGDRASARAMFDRWPAPIVTSQWQLGVDLPFPTGALTAAAGAGLNPVLEASKLHARNALDVDFPYDQPSYDLAAALYAIEPDAGHLTTGEPGEISVDQGGITSFTPGGHGQHRLVERPPEAATTARTIDRFVELATMLPER